MTLRNITIDNSVRYIAISEQSKEKNSKPKSIKAGSLPRKQNKNISRNSKKFAKDLQQMDLAHLQNSFCTSIRTIISLFIFE